jgi:hypothetical protein
MTDEFLPRRLAFILDGEVVETMSTDDRLGAIFLSQPLVLDITDRFDTMNAVGNVVGMHYDEDRDLFYIPVIE